VRGVPATAEPAGGNLYQLKRSYYTLDGEPVDLAAVEQGQRLVVVLDVTTNEAEGARLVLDDPLPAGFEIDNPHLVSSGNAGALPWITDTATPVHTEFRDDRFTAAFNRTKNSKPVFTVAYVVRAVTPGHYVLPQAFVEDMYRPDRFARTGTGAIEVSAAR